MTAQSLSAELASFAAGIRYGDLSEAARHETRRAIVNMVAAALGGCREDAIDRLARVLERFSGPAQATLIGRCARLDPLSAACLNAASANVLEFDDAHVPTIIHPAAPVAAAAFAIAEMRRQSGRDVLVAIALGIEIACRLGLALGPRHYARGFHITATCGVVGAAVAAGKLLDLPASALAHAIGIAATRAGGLVENLGFMAKSIGVGEAARAGMLAALTAEAGMDAASTALEGPRGFLHVLSDDPVAAAATDGLGTRWELHANTYKPYPCGVVLNPVLDAVLALRTAHRLSADEVASVHVRGHPLLLERADRPHVTTGREAKVSVQHAAAIALLRGRAGAAEFVDAAVHEPAVQRLRALVTAEADAAIPVGASIVRVTRRDGTVHQAHVASARGSADQPLTDADLTAKLQALATFCAPDVAVGPLADALWSLDQCADIRHVLSLCRPGDPRRPDERP